MHDLLSCFVCLLSVNAGKKKTGKRGIKPSTFLLQFWLALGKSPGLMADRHVEEHSKQRPLQLGQELKEQPLTLLKQIIALPSLKMLRISADCTQIGGIHPAAHLLCCFCVPSSITVNVFFSIHSDDFCKQKKMVQVSGQRTNSKIQRKKRDRMTGFISYCHK